MISVTSDFRAGRATPSSMISTGAAERARLVASSAWIASRSNDFARVAWADDVTQREGSLRVQGFVVGPQTRQRLLHAKGLDRDFLGTEGNNLRAAREWASTRRAPVTPDRDRHGSSRSHDLVGELDAAAAAAR